MNDDRYDDLVPSLTWGQCARFGLVLIALALLLLMIALAAIDSTRAPEPRWPEGQDPYHNPTAPSVRRHS